MSQLTLVKEVKNGAVMKDAKGEIFFRIDRVRLSYPFLGTPSEDEDDNGNKKKSWRTVCMLKKSTHTEIKDELKAHIQKLIKDNEAKVPADKWFLTNGDDKEDEAMHGHFLVTASDSKKRPKVRDHKGQIMDDLEEIDDLFYGGCHASVLIRPWFFAGKAKDSSKTYPKRVSANLVGVMRWLSKEDEAFGSGRIDDDGAWGSTENEVDNDDGMDDDGGL